MPGKITLTAGRLRELFRYDPETGHFYRLKAPHNGLAHLVGKPAGHASSNKYVQIRVDGKPYWAHRLAWLYTTGEWPESKVDHRDRDGHNNEWANLRLANDTENGQNRFVRRDSASGTKGIYWCRDHQKWEAYIVVNKQRICLGYRDNIEEAKALRVAASIKYFGDFASD